MNTKETEKCFGNKTRLPLIVLFLSVLSSYSLLVGLIIKEKSLGIGFGIVRDSLCLFRPFKFGKKLIK